MKTEDRPTPETDVVAVDVYETRVEKNEDGEFVYAYHARRLERQRDAWRDMADELAETLKGEKYNHDEHATSLRTDEALRHYAEAKKEIMG